MGALETIVDLVPYAVAAGFGYSMGMVGGETANMEESMNMVKGAAVISVLAGSIYHSIKWSIRDPKGSQIIGGIAEGVLTGAAACGAGILGDVIYRA